MSPVFVFIFHLGDFIPYGYCTFGTHVRVAKACGFISLGSLPNTQAL